MGMSPAEVDKASLWQFGAAVDGFNRAHSTEKDAGALSDAEAAELGRWLDKAG